MPDLPNHLKKDLAFIIQQTGSAAASVFGAAFDTELALQTDLAAAEIALRCLVAADSLERIGDSSSLLMRSEIARRLKELAFLCLDVLETDEKREIRSLLRAAREKADSIADLTGIPKSIPAVEAGLVPAAASEGAAASTELQICTDTEGEDSAERLRAEIRALRELLASLVFERDNLINVVLRDIEAAYMRELGGLEIEAYQAEYDARLLKRKLEMMQASLNRGEFADEKTVNERIREEDEAFRRRIEDLLRQFVEAFAYSQQRTKQKERRSGKTGGPNAPKADDSGDGAEDGPKEETEEQELRRLYRKIVKAMHPDLHPDQDEATKELFKRAILAYKNFDLQILREISAMLDGGIPEDAEDVMEKLLQERSRLLNLIHSVRTEIRKIKSEYPYTKKELLEDPEKLAAEKQRLHARIDSAKRAAAVYQERIAEITRKYGRTDPAAE